MTLVLPSVSVVTVTFNSRKHIEGCVASMQGQTHVPREHIVIDGASQDGTVPWLQERHEAFDVLVSEPDSGIYNALNKGLARAGGDVVGFLHSDDVYADADVLADVAQAFADPSVSAVYGDLAYVAADGTPLRRCWRSQAFRPWMLRWGWMPPHPTLYVRRACYEAIGGFDERFRISGDYHSVLMLFSLPGFRAVHLPRVLVHMRTDGASQTSWTNAWRINREDFRALRSARTGAWGGAGALLVKNLRMLKRMVS